MGMLPASHWELGRRSSHSWLSLGAGSLLRLLGGRSRPTVLWSFPEITSRGQPGPPSSRSVVVMQKKTRGHPVSPPRLGQNPHCSPSNKRPLPAPPFSCSHFDAIGLRPGFLKPSCPGSSLLKPGPRVLRWACHHPSLKPVASIYLFLVSPPPMQAEAISGPRYRVLICGSASVFSVPSSHSPPARCLGRRADVSFWPGSGLYARPPTLCDLWLPIGFPRAAGRRLLQSEFSVRCLQLPAVAGGHPNGRRRKDWGCTGFLFFIKPTPEQRTSPLQMLSGFLVVDEEIFLCYSFKLCSNKNGEF